MKLAIKCEPRLCRSKIVPLRGVAEAVAEDRRGVLGVVGRRREGQRVVGGMGEGGLAEARRPGEVRGEL